MANREAALAASTTKKPLRWVRLDNAAKIYPAARRKNWSNIFRQSVTLWEDVDTAVLQTALDVTVKRFPSIAARLRKGVFWYYLQQVETAPPIREEYSYPLVYMSKAEMRQCAFRVIVYHNRIAVEFFHSLTDGAGALIFLKSLTAEYLEQKHGICIPCEEGVLDRRAAPKKEELEDSFLKNGGPVPSSRKDTNAWHMTGEEQEDGFLHLTCFHLSVQETLAAAHRFGFTLTVFMSAVMMQALCRLQKEKNPIVRRQKRIKLLIPINLRQLFPSHTLRNFAMYTIPEIDPRLGDYSLEEIGRIVTAVVVLLRYVKRGRPYIYGGTCIAVGGWLFLLELLMGITFDVRFIGWSIYPLLVLTLLGGLLIYLGIDRVARETIKRKLFF